LRRLWASQEGVEPLGGPFALPFQQVPVTIAMYVDAWPTKSPISSWASEGQSRAVLSGFKQYDETKP
jgi:hypothetical protein